MKEILDEFKKLLLDGNIEEAMELANYTMEDNITDLIENKKTNINPDDSAKT